MNNPTFLDQDHLGQNQCLHHLFETQVHQTPEAVAVVFPRPARRGEPPAIEQLTYRTLNERANRLARHLQKMGVGPDAPVGLCLERSINMVVGVLGIFKAGGAYVPLDPAYPPERLAFMVKDSRLPVLVTQHTLLDRLPASQARLIYLDTQPLTESEENPDGGATADNLAYIIYTSGSTGRPKGVAMPHRPLANLIAWQGQNSGAGEGARTLQYSPFSFDVSCQEMFATWGSGGALVLIPDEVRRDPVRLWRFLAEQAIERLFLPFIALQTLAQAAGQHEIKASKLREVITAGEQLQITPDIARLFAALPDCKLYNQYGPTESHVVTAFGLDGSPKRWPALPPIGRPITNARIYILDPHLRPAPAGETGELYIGGSCLARGYLHRPALTAERFIPDPFSRAPGARMYKTGDLACFRPDGQIEFKGRSDEQVKIRGVRIEPGEIEVTLREHAAIRDAAVVVREAENDRQLVAYLVAQGNPPPSIAQLRQLLQDKLPDPMVPAAFVLLEELPLTPSGKIDRRSLPAPGAIRPELSTPYVSPRNPLEKELADLWASLLGLKQVGVQDNFLELGGHSLLATRLISRLRDRFGLELPLYEFFENATVSGLAERLDLRAANRMKAPAVPPLRPAGGDGHPDLSFAQQRLWFLDQLEAGSCLYNVPTLLYLTGTLDQTALEQSLTEIVRRHEILRTTFTTIDGRPAQVIGKKPGAAWRIPTVDLQHLPETSREKEAHRLAIEAARQPFDLAQGPLLRLKLWRLTGERAILLLAMHHIICDGWSIEVLLQELAVLYPALRREQTDPLPALPVQYADFARWQRQWLQGEGLADQLAYWRQQLSGMPAMLPLPVDHPRQKVQRFRGKAYPFEVSRPTTEALRAVGRQTGATLFMVLLAAFKTLLHHYTGQVDLIVGSPIANRGRTELERLIGFFANTLILRTDLSGNLTFRELLDRIREMTLAAYAHQDLPFEKLVEALQPERSLSHQPLFQVLFVWQTGSLPVIEWSDLGIRAATDIDIGTARFDLTLSITETEEELQAAITYNTDLFETGTIARMTGHFNTLLEGLAADPARRVSDLPLLTPAERQTLLLEWNETRADYPLDLCIHHLFESQAQRTPGSPAVRYEETCLTYQTLNIAANRLAHYLQSLGVGPEIGVGLCLERSTDLLVGLLAILKAGGAYVPLEPELPPERLAFMIADAGAQLVVTRQQWLDKLPENSIRPVCLDSESERIGREPPVNPAAEVTAANLCYVLFTSGSTGQPKGVAVEHRQLVNYVYGILERLELPAQASFATVSTIAADLGNTAIFPALSTGGLLHLIGRERATDPNALADYFRRYRVDCLKIVPSHLTALLAAAHPEQILPHRRLILGGEASTWDLVRTVQRLAPGCQIFNHYGPTETTVGVITYRVEAGRSEEAAGILPLGYPLPNSRVYLLDAHLNPVPSGVPAELHIGGRGVSRGYLNRPATTAERFIPDPFSQEVDARLYKSGDLARYRPDGTLEFLGRLDHQVKIRGFRIELAEIEKVLTRHPQVREAIVLARTKTAGSTPHTPVPGAQLVAYMVPKKAEGPTPDAFTGELRRFLQAQLPDYMLPAAYVPMAALPLTANGKVDRQALPPPGRIDGRRAKKLAAPRNQAEKTLAAIWADLLGLPAVGVQDNFFELGGDSILSIQVIARANQAGLYLTPKQLFLYQTVAELAAAAGKAPLSRSEQGIVMGSVPLTPIQRWFFEQNLAEPHHWNMSIQLETGPGVKAALLEQAGQALLRQHDALRLRFERTGAGQQQFHADPDEILAFSRLDLSGLSPAEQEQIARTTAAELQRSLQLDTGPLLRIALLDPGPQQPKQVLFIAHHLLVDGVSWRILLEDLETAYRQLSRNEPVQLAPKTTAFKTWAEALARYAQSEILQAEASYWLTHLPEQATPLPVDYPAGPANNTEASTAGVMVTLTKEETTALLQDVPAAFSAQINDVLLTALARTLAGWIGERQVLVELEGHGREEIIEGVDLSRTVGWFTTHFPLLLEVDITAPPDETLQSIKEQLRRIPNRGIGYGLLRYLSADTTTARRLRRLPQPEISFNYLGRFDQVLSRSTEFRFIGEPDAPVRSPLGRRSRLLHVEGVVKDGQLILEWLYSHNIHHQETIQMLAAKFVAGLRDLISRCRSQDVGSYGPSDFPLAGLDQVELTNRFGRDQAIEEIYPLSPAQEEMFHYAVQTGRPDVYSVQLSFSLRGRLNVDHFRQAWQQLVDQHAVLRTGFNGQDLATPLQVVSRRADLAWDYQDWRRLPHERRLEALRALLEAGRRRGFDLNSPPLMRLSLRRMADDQYQLIWSNHHLIKDGWSTALLLEQLLSGYHALCQDRSLPPAQGRPFRDYIAWLEEQNLDRTARPFWQEHLAGRNGPVELNIDRSPGRPPDPQITYGRQQIRLSPARTAALQRLARQQRLTLSALVQAAWALLLSGYSGQMDITFGLTVSGRTANLPGIDKIVGPLINTLPQRIDLRPKEALVNFLHRLQERQVELQQYEHTPGRYIQQWLGLSPDQHLFESVLRFQNYPAKVQAADQTGLQIEQTDWYDVWPYPLSLVVEPGDALSAWLHYDEDRFEAIAISALLERFKTIVVQFSDDPHRPVGTLLERAYEPSAHH